MGYPRFAPKERVRTWLGHPAPSLLSGPIRQKHLTAYCSSLKQHSILCLEWRPSFLKSF